MWTEEEVEDTCDPIVLNKDISKDLHSYGGLKLDPNEVAYPCGRIAKYYFSDTFKY